MKQPDVAILSVSIHMRKNADKRECRVLPYSHYSEVLVGDFCEVAIDDTEVDLLHGVSSRVVAGRVSLEGNEGNGILHEQVVGDLRCCFGAAKVVHAGA